MSYHCQQLNLSPPRVMNQLAYVSSLHVYRPGSSRPDSLAAKVLLFVAGQVLSGRPCKPGQKALGRFTGRSERSIRRAVKALVTAGYVEVRRRGKKLSNAYRLVKALWSRLVNRPYWPARPQAGPSAIQLELRAIMDRARLAYYAGRGS